MRASGPLLPLVAVLLAACAQAPLKPSATHLGAADVTEVQGSIPPPVQMPVLPKPTPAIRPEIYSVVVNNVRVQDLLFALARDARINFDIHPGLEGSVTLNALDQTLPQLLARLARQVDMRYEFDGQNLIVMRDTPFLRSYKIDYLSAARSATMKSTASTQFGGATAGGAGATTTGGTATIEITTDNKLWENIVQNVKDILRETDKIIPKATPDSSAQQPRSAAPAPAAPGLAAPPAVPGAQPAAAQPQHTEFIELASVIGNRESGTLFVRATSRQQEKVREFLDLVMASARRQVLIEATVAEVQLRNEYQRGIEWQRLAAGGLAASTGFRFIQPAIGSPTGFNANPFVSGFISRNSNFTSTLRLLDQFGDVKVLSSPKLSVLNNQTAILRVTRDIIYFTLKPVQTAVSITTAAGGTPATVQPAFETTPNVAAEGFMMTVLPQVNDADAIVLNVRPTIRRQVGSTRDPNPALQGLANQNDIPLFETREFDSMLRLQSGDVGVLAGLMQDSQENTDSGIPGVRSVPGLGTLLSQRSDLSRKTELVIFIRATVIRNASLSGDYRSFRDLLPDGNFFGRPNPGKVAPIVGPTDAPLQ